MKKFLLYFWLSISSIHIIHAQKNDTVFLKNGDRITGEIKKLEYGLLTLKTDGLQTINIKFDRLNTLHSNKLFEIVTIMGSRFFGSLSKSPDTGNVILNTSKGQVIKPLSEIVQMATIKDKFISKIDGSIGLGFNYTKASDVLQYNITALVSYRATDYLTVFDLNNIITDEQSGGLTRNNNIGLSVTRFMSGKWFAKVQAKAQQNTELDLKLRMQSGGGVGYDLVRTSSKRFHGLMGLLYNHEQTLDSSTISNNIEGMLSIQYKRFQLHYPNIDITSGFTYYPSITIYKRYRLELNINAKLEIINDLFFNLNFYDSFDSNTLSDNSRKNDFGIISSFSYSF